MLKPLNLAVLAFVVLGTATFAQKSVIVVDINEGPGYHYKGIRAAITAADEGDVLLVRNSAYGSATIDGKSLAIVSEDPHASWISTLVIQNLDATQAVSIRGFDGYTLEVINSAGAVLIEDAGLANATVTNSSNVVLRSTSLCEVFPFYDHAITAVDSEVFVYDSLLKGADGGNFEPGKAGAHLTNSTLLLHGSRAVGGDGYFEVAFGGFILPPSAGVYASGISSVLRTLDSQVVAGTKAPTSGDPPAPDIELTAGATQIAVSGSERLVTSASPIREGEATRLTYTGEPGDAVWLAVSRVEAPARFFAIAGYFHGKLPLLSFTRIGTIPASGVLDMPFIVPNLPGSIEVHPLHLTAYVVGNGGGFLTGPTKVHALDSAF